MSDTVGQDDLSSMTLIREPDVAMEVATQAERAFLVALQAKGFTLLESTRRRWWPLAWVGMDG